MSKIDFRMTSIFKIIIRICLRKVESCRKTSKFLLKRCLFVFCIFYLNNKELNQQVYLIKYVENKVFNSTPLTKKKTERSKNIIQLQKHF